MELEGCVLLLLLLLLLLRLLRLRVGLKWRGKGRGRGTVKAIEVIAIEAKGERGRVEALAFRSGGFGRGMGGLDPR